MPLVGTWFLPRDHRAGDLLNILILGASVRAAAHSALRAGWRPVGVDLFADRDLTASCQAHRVSPAQYPGELEAVAGGLPNGPWFYTGALENHPDLVDRVARHRPLWGNAGSALRAARDPQAVADALQRAGLPCPGVRLDPRGLPRDGRWLVKPLASSSGRGIAPLGPGSTRPALPSYYQERIDGIPLAALALGHHVGARLLGVTWQWLGRPGAPFAYRGSIGPWPLSGGEQKRIAHLGTALASAFGILGLFGIDLILKDGEPWPVEINPRYTASVEVLELVLMRPLLADHGQVFDPTLRLPLLGTRTGRAQLPGVVGKAILFAERTCTLPIPARSSYRRRDWFAVPRLADVPQIGERFEAGQPVLTVFARAVSLEACRERLERKLAAWNDRLRPETSADPISSSGSSLPET
jgi:uncharacterized protein